MSVIDSKTAPQKRSASPSVQPIANQAARAPYRILAVVDGTERTNHVVDFLRSLAAHGQELDVVVLNVQTKRPDHRLRGYQSFKQQEIDDRLINEIGMPIVGHVSRRLEKLGIAAHGRVEIGEPADVIIRCAAEEHCDSVVIGEQRLSELHRILARALGLLSGAAASLIALSDKPVIVVK